MNLQEPTKLTSPEFHSKRKVLGVLIITNCLFYAALIPLVLSVIWREFAAYSIAIILGYNILEALLFFGCQTYNWPCTLTFRIIWVLHDLAYLLTFAVDSDYYYADFNDEDYQVFCDKDSYYYDSSLCKVVRSFIFAVTSCVIYFVTICLGVAIMVTYSKFPKYGCEGCCVSQAHTKPIVVSVDGNMYQIQSNGNSYEAHVIQNIQTSTVTAVNAEQDTL